MDFSCVVLDYTLSLGKLKKLVVMAVKELKEQLETLSDNADVYWYTGGDIQQADALLYKTCW